MEENKLDFNTYYQVVSCNSSRPASLISSADWYINVIHLPRGGYPEVIWELEYKCGRPAMRITRFLSSAYHQLLEDKEKNQPYSGVEVEIGFIELTHQDFSVREICLGIARECKDLSFGNDEGEVFSLHFLDRSGVYLANVVEPFSREDAEPWQRLLNRLIGTGMKVPRRFVAA